MGFNESTMTFESIYNYSFDSKDSHVNVHLDDDLVPVSVTYKRLIPHRVVTVTPTSNGYYLETDDTSMIVSGLEAYSLGDHIKELATAEEEVTEPFDQSKWDDRDFTKEASEEISK